MPLSSGGIALPSDAIADELPPPATDVLELL
jgi:hypothetical protein